MGNGSAGHGGFRRRVSRREALKMGGAFAAAAAALPMLSACGGGDEAEGGGAIQWWDHFLPLSDLHKDIFAQYREENPDARVEYQVYNTPDLAQALQSAYRSEQTPDVHSIAGLGIPVAALIGQGWFGPLQTDVRERNSMLSEFLFDGIHIFEGEVHSFPIFNPRQYATLNWFDKQLMEGAGFDPEAGPATWDEFREAAREMTRQGDDSFGWIAPLTFVDRLGEHLYDLAMVAGAPGPGGTTGAIDWSTGEYNFGSEPYVQAVEFLVSMQQDGVLNPSSASLDARTGRARWASGAGGMFFDGPWNAGVLQADYQEFLETVGVGPLPVPEANGSSYKYSSPSIQGAGTFWLSSQSQNPEAASELLSLLTSEDYYVRLAGAMDQPPLDLGAVEQSDAHPTYKQAVSYFRDTVRLAPDPLAKNPAVGEVQAEMQVIHPNVGEIVQGALTGDIEDYAAALQEYSDKMTAERDQALETVQSRGTEVSLDDWVFEDWQPDEDYTRDLYG